MFLWWEQWVPVPTGMREEGRHKIHLMACQDRHSSTSFFSTCFYMKKLLHSDRKRSSYSHRVKGLPPQGSEGAWLIYHQESPWMKIVFLFSCDFDAGLWDVLRRKNKRGECWAWPVYSDITNNGIYDGIIQFIYFPLKVPIKRWHFPSLCSWLMFYVFLSSRVCVLWRVHSLQC